MPRLQALQSCNLLLRSSADAPKADTVTALGFAGRHNPSPAWRKGGRQKSQQFFDPLNEVSAFSRQPTMTPAQLSIRQRFANLISSHSPPLELLESDSDRNTLCCSSPVRRTLDRRKNS